MGFRDLYATDKNAEEEGTWVDLGEEVSIKIRRASSKKSKEVRKRLEKPYISMMRRDNLPDKIQEELTAKHVAEGILLDWKGVTDEAGAEIPFSVEAAVKICMQFNDFRDDVIQHAVEAGTFRSQVVEEARENLSPTSAGA